MMLEGAFFFMEAGEQFEIGNLSLYVLITH